MPAVDGNVLRILTRVAADDTDIMKQSFRSAVEAQLGEMMRELTVLEELRRALRDENVPGALNRGDDGARGDGLCAERRTSL